VGTVLTPLKKSPAVTMPSLPRVLHVFNRYRFYGGEEAAVERISQVLREREVPFEEVLASSEEWEAGDGPPRWKQALLSLYNPKGVARVRAAHERLRADVWVVHNLFPVLSLGVLREAHRLGVPVVFYLHNYMPYSTNGALWANDRLMPEGLRGSFLPEIRASAWQDSLVRTAWKATVLTLARRLGWYRQIAAWVAVSEFVKDRFVEAGVPVERVHVLAYPFFPTETEPVCHQEDAGFLFLGRLSVAKGTRVVLEAWRQLREEAAGDRVPTLTIAGDGELRNEVEEAAENSCGSIRYAGQVSGEAKQRLIDGSLALVVPSVWWDPYPTVVYEAFDAGRAVMAARSGGLPESVQDGFTGRLHTPGDANELAGQIKAAWRDQEKTLKMGSAGRDWLLNRAGGERWWTDFEKVLKQVSRQPDANLA
jgi:glycosyltransferase involved in cell wall biosynthesis